MGKMVGVGSRSRATGANDPRLAPEKPPIQLQSSLNNDVPNRGLEWRSSFLDQRICQEKRQESKDREQNKVAAVSRYLEKADRKFMIANCVQENAPENR